jgi:hypothetical protein
MRKFIIKNNRPKIGTAFIVNIINFSYLLR